MAKPQRDKTKVIQSQMDGTPIENSFENKRDDETPNNRSTYKSSKFHNSKTSFRSKNNFRNERSNDTNSKFSKPRRSFGAKFEQTVAKQSYSDNTVISINGAAHKGTGVVGDLSMSLHSKKVLGYNPSGISVNDYDLQLAIEHIRLGIFGNEIPGKSSFDEPVGEIGKILNQLVADLQYPNDIISTATEFRNAPNSVGSVGAILPKSAYKQLKHNYKGFRPSWIPGNVNDDALLASERLFVEDVNNIMLTFLDTLGTTFEINGYFIKQDGVTVPAIYFLLKLYDVVLCRVLNLWTRYTQWTQYINYAPMVSQRFTDYLNNINGAVIRSATMNGAISTLFNSLTKFNLPLDYYNKFINSVVTVGKRTSDRSTPLEFINVDIPIVLYDIVNKDNKIIINKTLFQEVLDSIDAVIKEYNFKQYEFDVSTNVTAINSRNRKISIWETVNVQLNSFFDLMLPLTQAMQRGLDTKLIKGYTNNRDTLMTVDTLINYLNSSIGSVNGNDIGEYNYIAINQSMPQANGTTITVPLIPNKTFKPFFASSGIQLFIGEDKLYYPLYDVTGDVLLTLNNAETNDVNQGSYYLLRLIDKDTPSVRWQLEVCINNNNSVGILPNNPLINLLTGTIVPNMDFEAEVTGVNQRWFAVDPNTYSGGFTYNIQSLWDKVYVWFKYMMTARKV